MGQFTQNGVTYEELPDGKVRVIGHAQMPAPGSIGGNVVAPNPALVAIRQAEQERAARADARAANSDARAAAGEARAARKDAMENADVKTPGDDTLSGDAYLATLPKPLAAQVKALSEGRRAFPTGAALRNPQIMALVAAASQYDPTLDAANAATRVATRKKFTSGTTRDNITAINTALGHLGTLAKDGAALNNFGSPMINAPVNAIESGVMGDKRVSNFNITRHAVVDELEKAFRGSGGTQAGIEEWKASINSSQSPDQLDGAVRKGVELLQSRLDALGAAYSEGMGHSADPLTFLNPHAQAVFSAFGPGGSGVVPDVPKGGSPPILGGGDTPPTPPAGGQTVAATGATKDEYDAVASAKLNALIRHGRPYAEAAAMAKSEGFNVPDPGQYAAAVGYAKTPEGKAHKQSLAEAIRTTPTSLFNQVAASDVGATLAGASSAISGGFNDEIAGGLTALGGGDYTQGRDAFNANKTILADAHPVDTAIGNVAGGVLGTMAGGAGLAKFAPGLEAAIAGRLAPTARAMAGDAAYGAVYGAGENNDNRVLGGVEGAFAGLGGGMAGRGATRGLANIIAPPAGDFAASYAKGSFPTMGQRFGQVPFVGKAINGFEQAMQSVPGLGSMVARAREIPRQAQKIGMVNDALSHIEPHQPGSMLPANITTMGTEAQAHAATAFDGAFDKARSGMQFVPDQPYIAETTELAKRVNSAEFTPDQSARVKQAVNDSVVERLRTNGGVLAGDEYVRAGSEIGRIADTWAKNPDTAHMADALRGFTDAFDGAAVRASDPAAGQMLSDTKAGFAKLVRLQKAGGRVGGEAGDFTPKALSNVVQAEGGMVRKNAFNQGKALMQDDALALSRMGDTLPNSGTAERLGSQAVVGLGGLGVGAPAAIMAHPGSLAPFALYAPGMNKMVTRAIAPRSATLSPAIAQALEGGANQIRGFAPTMGRLAPAVAVPWWLGQ